MLKFQPMSLRIPAGFSDDHFGADGGKLVPQLAVVQPQTWSTN